MKSSLSNKPGWQIYQFPDLQILMPLLICTLKSNGYSAYNVNVSDRKPNLYASTCQSEIVTCRLDHGVKLKLFCKYEISPEYESFGHRGGITYEAEVYRQVLHPLNASTPKFYGSYKDVNAGWTCLILGYLEKGVRFTKSSDPDVVSQVGRWIAEFHRQNEIYLPKVANPKLYIYDEKYYIGWSRRTLKHSRYLHQKFPWLPTLCRQFEEYAGILLSAPQTIIHGEYYPKNILYREGVVYPVDWESCAIAAGEIDLASLTAGWDLEIVKKIELEYEKCRWPDRSPNDFQKVLDAARLYWLFRWLGDRPDWTSGINPSL